MQGGGIIATIGENGFALDAFGPPRRSYCLASNRVAINKSLGTPVSSPSRADQEPRMGRPQANLLSDDCWLELPEVPLDLDGPTALPYVRFEASCAERPICELFYDVVERFPNRIAVDDGVDELTYHQLWNGACRVAQTISAAVASRGPIGVVLANDAHYAVGVLGCLLAGRPCVLLDRHYPAARNQAIIRDAGLAAILADAPGEANEGYFPSDLPVIAGNRGVFGQSLPATSPDDGLPIDDPAFIIYTSGSTGQPKGIVLSQRTVLQRAGQMINSIHLSAADRSLPLGSPCTIAGLQQMFEALLVGAMLIRLDLQRKGFSAVLDTITSRRVNLLFATPTLLRSLVQLDGARDLLRSLRCVHPSGEVLMSADLRLLRQCLPASCNIIVVYGLTEAPAICQWFVPKGVGDEQEARVAVGYRLPGHELAVVDQDGRPLGFDETGELVIRSRCAAIGEWHDGHVVPGRLAPDPSDPFLRILRTGDLVRVRRDGVVVVIGRQDRQVKIRGMRVEPGEVESVLRRSPAVLDAAVGVRHEGVAATLVAFVVLRQPDSEEAAAALRTVLRESLPPYMQPARIVIIKALPLLPGHKVDIDALLALDDAARTKEPSPAPASAMSQTHAHAALAQAWGNVLDRCDFMADLPFDQAGGDSLKLLQLAFEIEVQYGVAFPLSILDLSMRPSEFVSALNDALPSGPAATMGARVNLVAGDEDPAARSSPLVLLRAGDRTPPIFLAHGLGGHVGGLVRLARHLGTRHPVYALQAGGDVVDRITGIAKYFEDAIEAVEPAGPYLLIGYSLGGLIMFELAQRLSRSGRQVGLLALLDTYPHPWFWPLRTRFRWWARRVRYHASALAKLELIELLPQLGHLFGAFTKDIGRVFWPSLPPLPATQTDPVLRRLRTGLIEAEAHYRPQFYPGKLTFLRAQTVERMPDDPHGVWQRVTKEIEIITVPGSHLSMIITESLGTQLSACLRRALGEGGEELIAQPAPDGRAPLPRKHGEYDSPIRNE
jgi:amino acid adenylation domain-containing protein